MPRTPPSTAYQPLLGLASLVLVIASLYWAQAVLLPLALAVLFAFMLNPIVRLLHRRGLGRRASVLLVVLLTFLFLGVTGWVVTDQMSRLASELSLYERNIEHKLVELQKAGKGAFLSKVQSLFQRARQQTEKEDPRTPEPVPREKPLAVVVEADRRTGLLDLLPALAPVLRPVGSVFVVILLVISMLYRREDLRNRLIQLTGAGRLTLTTRAMDEASQRISFYLLVKSSTNACFGIALGLGLFLIGVPYATLWSFLTAVFRFIPSLGTWLGAVGPAVLALVAFDGWGPFLLVLALYAVLELITSNLIEPRLVTARIGVSPVALFIALIFWTWLWGPPGLVLATPLTVCLAVLGKHVPQLEFLSVLLSDQPALGPDLGYYQRLLARDQDEAADIIADQLRSAPVEQVFDELLVPALIYARRDLANGKLADEDARFVLEATRELVEEIALTQQKAVPTDSPPADDRARVLLVACPARDETDDTALLMFRQLLDPASCAVELTTSATLTSELIALIEAKRPSILCIAALPPGGLTHLRLLCKRLRSQFLGLRIVVGRWGLKGNLDRNRAELVAAGADHVTATLRETCSQVAQLVQLQAYTQPAPLHER